MKATSPSEQTPTRDHPAQGPPPQEKSLRPIAGPPSLIALARHVSEEADPTAMPVPAETARPVPDKATVKVTKPLTAPSFATQVDEPTALGRFFADLPLAVKVFMAALFLAALVWVTSSLWQPPTVKTKPVVSVPEAAMMVPGENASAGWSTEFAADVTGAMKERQLTLYRQSMGTSSYRFTFSGQIVRGGLGWVLRATDARNYYGMKIEVVKPGVEPVVRFFRFAVVNGQERDRTQLPLPVAVRDMTLFDVQVEASGSRFVTKIRNNLVDDWTDGNLTSGAAGFLSDRGDLMRVENARVVLVSSPSTNAPTR